jgi:peptidoglycan hydrolase-like protein with peptidoglycan-binding domain
VNRRLLLPLAAVVLAAVASGATWAVAGAKSGSAPAESSAPPRATAIVERRNLVQHETASGALVYADAAILYAQAVGTVTGLREPGRVVERGEALYRLNGQPVTLMYGRVPMWRRLDPSSEAARDIRQLERNLVALGFDPSRRVEIDDEWGSATTAAVQRWQGERGLPKTGAVELGQIAFLLGPRRIGQLKTTPGALVQPGGEVLETTSTRRVVTVDLDADKRALVSRGDRVIVGLPDGRSVRGTIAEISKVAEAETDPQSGEQIDPTILVEVRLRPHAKTGGFDQTPVDVSLEKERAKNALAVPVSALLALAEGGFAVEVVGARGSTRLVRVQLGMFADGFVQISGRGIEQGTKVAVPA